MAGRFLLDTNIVSAMFKSEPQVEASARGHRLYLSATVLGELYFGAEKGNRIAENLDRIGRFASSSHVVPCDQRTAQIYAQIKARLKKTGSPIPENDIWIAASALQHGLTLATRDGHFNFVEGLPIASW